MSFVNDELMLKSMGWVSTNGGSVRASCKEEMMRQREGFIEALNDVAKSMPKIDLYQRCIMVPIVPTLNLKKEMRKALNIADDGGFSDIVLQCSIKSVKL